MATRKRLGAPATLGALAARIMQRAGKGPTELALERLEAELGDASRYDIVASLKELEKSGAGRFVVGGKGKKSRFVWNGGDARSAQPDAGRTRRALASSERDRNERAARPTAVGGLSGPAPRANSAPENLRTLQHSFHLRPGVVTTLELPADVTKAEVERLCAFLQAIPFQ